MPEVPIRGRDPRFLAGMLLLAGILAVSLDAPASLALLAAAGLGWALATRPGARQLLLLAAALALAVWALMFSQALFYRGAPKTVLFVLVPPEAPLLGWLTGGLSASYEGVLHGAVQSLRLVATLSAGLAVAWTIDPSRLLPAFSALRLPHALSFCAATAIRFLPVTVGEAQTALRALRMRGLRLRGPGAAQSLRTLASIARPVLAASIRRAETVALASASRAYDPERPRTSLLPLVMTPPERAALAAAALLTALVVAAKALYLLYAAGLLYHPALAPLYTLTREAL